MSTNDQDLCLVFIPALVTLLYKAEKDKGSPLTENEVIKIRDSATCMAVQFSAALEMEEKRGYPDIVAEEAWSEWQAARKELFGEQQP
ncbi:hypothetical protein LGR51_08485 [Pseudomonas sp. NP21570]|uniref:hypothetical protein n=1 Tax=Stutzerimonas kunmingensis TaxID=1211807 RepID=UPI0015604B43|nr:hypothetical protein [Stutzerimonas kunmingensis]MCB4794539.1 hypothetical protein [Pseudomonas sp. NP21570]NRF49048.1 hypothetical protein [Stutzerimonas stutzeri]